MRQQDHRPYTSVGEEESTDTSKPNRSHSRPMTAKPNCGGLPSPATPEARSVASSLSARVRSSSLMPTPASSTTTQMPLGTVRMLISTTVSGLE